jgi:hypothetical protein
MIHNIQENYYFTQDCCDLPFIGKNESECLTGNNVVSDNARSTLHGIAKFYYLIGCAIADWKWDRLQNCIGNQRNC